jgi:hypothetical protein
VYGQGDAFERNFGAYRIGFTMLECDRLPDEWVRQANQMDEVWVPAPFNADTFRASGVTRPIHVIPLGFDPNYFSPAIRGYRIEDLFTFLSVFEWRERKAPELLLKAFNDEFRANEPVVLVCHALKDDRHDLHRAVADLGLSDSGGRVTLLVNQLLPYHQLGALYRSADCFVLPTRAEGWGLPMLEAMACGVPVIATDWSAHTLFVNVETAYPIAVERLVEAESQVPYYRGAFWAQPSYEDCRRQMRTVFENQEEARAKGLRAAEWVRTRFTWAHSATTIADRLHDIGATSGAAQRAARAGGTASVEGI